MQDHYRGNQSQLRAIMSADDQFDLTMQLLASKGVLDNTLVILSSDNGYMWGEHGRWEKFVPYEPSIRVPLLVRWPGHITAGTDTSRIVSYLDLLPTVLQAAGYTLPTGAPRLDGESLLQTNRRTTMYAEYYVDAANPNIPSWRMVRTATAKYVQTYNPQGAVIAREYYNLTTDPAAHQPPRRHLHHQRSPRHHRDQPDQPTQRLRHLRRNRLRAVTTRKPD